MTGGVTVAEFDFDLDVSSRVDADGVAKGQIQFTRVDSTNYADMTFHVVVDCVVHGPSGYAMSGPAKTQAGTHIGDYVSVEVNDAGTAVRVRPVSEAERTDDCGYSGSYPGDVSAGSFNTK